MKIGNYEFFWPHVGNRQITEFLAKSIAHGEVAGTYIYCGPDNLGKTTIAKQFAQSLLCLNKAKGKGVIPCGECPSCLSFSGRPADGEAEEGEGVRHGDYHILKKPKDKKNISVEDVREFIRALSMSSFLDGYKIGIVKHADKLSREAANALLKTLEEPNSQVVIVLIAKFLDALPQTIVSRSQVLHFRPVNADIIYDYLVEKYQAPRSLAKNLSRLCLGRPALAVKFYENKDFYDEYTRHAKMLMDFAGQDINERLLQLGEFSGKKFTGQEAVVRTARIIEVWQGVARDWLLLELGHKHLVQNEFMIEALAAAGRVFPVKKIVAFIRELKKSEEYLRANVSPALVLENIAINL